VVFYAFPQEVVNQIAERTGSRPVSVEIPDLWALHENLDKCAFYAAFWKATNWVLVAAKRCAFSSR